MKQSFAYWGIYCPHCYFFSPLYEAKEMSVGVYEWTYPDMSLGWELQCHCDQCHAIFPFHLQDIWLVESKRRVIRYRPNQSQKREDASDS